MHKPNLAPPPDLTLPPPPGLLASSGDGCGAHVVWQLFEGVCSLLDRLGAWPHLASGASDLREMAQIGLHLVLGYILLEDPQVSTGWSWGGAGVGCSGSGWVPSALFSRPQLHAQAHVRLHSLLQTAVPMRREEACYVLSKLEAVLARALHPSPCEVAADGQEPPARAAASMERCSWLVPLVRTLLDRAYEPLGLQWGLPSLPPTNGSPTFFEDFQDFCATPEWRHFIDKQVPGGGGAGKRSVGWEPASSTGTVSLPNPPGAAHHVPVRNGHLRQEPRSHVGLLELLLRHTHEQRAAAPAGAGT